MVLDILLTLVVMVVGIVAAVGWMSRTARRKPKLAFAGTFMIILGTATIMNSLILAAGTAWVLS